MATADKYDRQLRLWGASGQRALGETLVVLIGSSACGTETLKNLVLPGVGSFLVVDDDDDNYDHDDDDTIVHNTTSADAAETILLPKPSPSPELTPSLLKFASASSNFFVPPPSSSSSSSFTEKAETEGQEKKLSKAAMASALLSELNPDVSGYYCSVPSLESIDYTSFLSSLLANINNNSNDSSSSTTSTTTYKKLLVISADQPSTINLPLSLTCHTLSIPLLFLKSYGLLATLKIQTPSPYHCIIESKPSHRIPDLRLSSHPLFEGLRQIKDGVGNNLEDLRGDSKEHSHVPFVIILLQALEKWRAASDDNSNNNNDNDNSDLKTTTTTTSSVPRYPSTFTEKENFRTLVKEMANNINNELNFEEALREAHLVWVEGRISDDVKLVLEKVEEEEFFESVMLSSGGGDGASSSVNTTPIHILQFQLLILAMKRFLSKNDNYPPLEGTIPDMTSDTARYVALQEAYQHQAENDRGVFRELILEILNECREKKKKKQEQKSMSGNGDNNDDDDGIRLKMPTDEEIQTFCKNCRYLRILETRPLFVEYPLQDPTSPSNTIINDNVSIPSNIQEKFATLQSEAREDLLSSTYDPYETDPVHTPLLWWIALRACDAFYDRYGHYPGKQDQELALESDANEVYKWMLEIVANLGLWKRKNQGGTEDEGDDDGEENEFIKNYIIDETKGKDLAREVVRYDEAEIHSIAAIIGGVASQEAVKLITGQYVPLDDTYVYNGIASTAGVYRF